MKKVAIIVAGGSGSRMNAPLPKQFLLIANEPVLFHTLRKFEKVADQTILVMHPEWITHWKQLIIDHHFTLEHSIVSGGETRAESVYNGLKTIDSNCLVAVHDAARPLVTTHLIEQTFETAEKHGACIPVISLKESIRRIQEGGSSSFVNREEYKIVQTPQTFQYKLLMEAYANENRAYFTDDASLVEASGQPVFLIEGEESNIKITLPTDLIIAQQFI
ncbi:MAG: 2-C-methyl-D-erythritol 4-phosphate cytidylyltransferase [Bacteroidota bacterium]